MALIGPSGRPISSAKPPSDSSAATASRAPSSGVSSATIKDASLATFAADVLDASRDVPVIVDFWAPWCGPCKQLTPLLEKVVNEAKGAVRLVKVNIDENQEIARQLRIQSIPTVFAFRNGQPVDGFMGAVPESQLRAFVQQLTGGAAGGENPIDEIIAMAGEAFEAGDVGTAAQAYAQVLQEAPGNPKAIAGLARCYLKSGDVARARNTLQMAKPEDAGDEALRAAEAEVSLREQAEKAGDSADLRAKLATDPNDHQARFNLALSLDGKGERDAAIDELLEIIRRDRKWNDDGARKHLVTLFEAMGPSDPRTLAGRRKLSALLFS